MIWGSGGSKSRLAKAAGAEPAGQMRDEKLHAVVARSTFPSQNAQNTSKHTKFGPLLEVEMSKKCTPLWREAHFQVKMHKTHQNTPGSDHFWTLRCRKSARRCGAKHISKSKCTKHIKTHQVRTTFGSCNVERHCGAKHISKSKCTKHHMFAPLLEVRMLKKCTPLWREAHFEVKMYKTPHVRTTFGGSDVALLHYTTLHYTPLHYTTLHNPTTTTTQLHSTTSSTAQGGGGSFKNRKPIGEVRGRESGMAERSHCWTERRLISLSLFL